MDLYMFKFMGFTADFNDFLQLNLKWEIALKIVQ